MIKRIIGTLFVLATLAVIVFAALNFGNYRSMVFKPRAVESAAAAVEQTDSLGMSVEEVLQQAEPTQMSEPANTSEPAYASEPAAAKNGASDLVE
jgi:hypothetical protein